MHGGATTAAKEPEKALGASQFATAPVAQPIDFMKVGAITVPKTVRTGIPKSVTQKRTIKPPALQGVFKPSVLRKAVLAVVADRTAHRKRSSK